MTGLKKLLKADDALDVFGVHALGGIFGALMTGIFNSPDLGGPGFVNNWFEMKPGLWRHHGAVHHPGQGVGVAALWSAVAAFISFKIADVIVGLRVPEDEEREGLDITSHGESAYHS